MWISIGTLYLGLSALLNSIGISIQSDVSPISSPRSFPAKRFHRTRLQGNDILMPLALEKWPRLAETLRKDWPANADYYYFIQTSIKWKSKEQDLPHAIYCPGGDYKSGFFVSIASFPVYHVIIFAHKGYEKLLHDAVTETKLIKWTEGVRFHGINARIISAVHNIIKTLKETKGIEVEWSIPGYSLFKPKEECAAVEVRVPEGCYLGRIAESHVPLIHSLWHGRDPEDPEKTLKYVRAMVTFNGGLGLFSRANNELLSWALQTEFGEIGVVQTIEKYKRKGYARVVVNAFSKELAKQGVDSFLYIAEGNSPSENLFKSSNWKVNQPDDYIQMKKLRYHNEV